MKKEIKDTVLEVLEAAEADPSSNASKMIRIGKKKFKVHVMKKRLSEKTWFIRIVEIDNDA